MRMIDRSITINKTNLKNRLVMPPMATAKSNVDGTVSQTLCEYYAEKSAGGYIGLIITEHSFINEEGKASKGQMSIDAGCDIEGLKKLTDTIHKNGSKVLCQLNHAGGAASREVTGHEPLSASGISMPKAKETQKVPKEMSSSDIHKVITDFAAAALRAKESGYDGVEIHSAHGYLLNQFYSPLTNKREDEYGGGIDGRIRIHLEIIRAIREAVGSDYPVALRLGACDYMEGGSTIEDGVYAAKQFEKAGVDLLDISGGFNGYMRKDTAEPGWFADASAAIKREVSIPVILTGGVAAVSDAEKLLSDEKADLIGVGRAILKDSLWAQNAMTLG